MVARTAYAARGEKFYKRLRNSLITTINSMALSLCQEKCIDIKEVNFMSFCGNRVMTTFLLGEDVSGISSYPYEPNVLKEQVVNWNITKRDDFGKTTDVRTVESYIMGTIGGNVGGDILAGVISNRLNSKKGKYLFLDMGTNGEVVFNDNGQLYCFSTAAGPAFEGGNIENGMVARNGAISDVAIENDNLNLKIIGDDKALGLCGSGLISAIAALVDYHIIRNDGALEDYDYFSRLHPYSNLKNRILDDRFVLEFASKENKKIYISQKDIREFQLAKGAIKGGIDLVINKLGINTNDVDEIVLAGGFGKNIRKEILVKSGILPNININKINFIGNSALAGVIMVLLNDDERKECETICKKIKSIELAEEKNFQDLFLEAMEFN